jgi:hypothetical protein
MCRRYRNIRRPNYRLVPMAGRQRGGERVVSA